MPQTYQVRAARLRMCRQPSRIATRWTVRNRARHVGPPRTKSSFLCHFAESDPWVSAAARRRLIRSFERDEIEAQYFQYPGTRHWFFESDRKDAFARGAAQLAWTRTLHFLGERLNE